MPQPPALARTYLFVPGDRPERYAKALASGADAVVVDLEDAVAPAAKDAARDAVARWLACEPHRCRVVVRINDERSPWFEADLALLQVSGAAAVMLPKADQASTIVRLRNACPGIGVLPLVETAAGMLAAQALAAAPGVQRLVFGTIDYALDLDLGDDPATLDPGASHLALVSRAVGLETPVAGVSTAIDDETALLADLARARQHGFGAKLCIHPRQVAPIHAALRPGEAELNWARRVLLLAEGASGAVQLDGRMVDKPVIERARRIVARAG
jgi:citrate lyase subunit beta/citryl-CoA lyase